MFAIIREARAKLEVHEAAHPDAPRNLLEAMLVAHDADDPRARLSDPEIYGNVLTLLLAGALIAVLSSIFEAVLGVDKPIIDTREDSPTYWRLIGRLPLKRRNWLIENIRLQQTYYTIYRYIADITVSRTPLITMRHAVQRWIYGEKTHADLTAPQKVRILLQDLGPTYVKIGQMASSRPELLPAEYTAELARLQSSVRPFPYDQMVDVIRQCVGLTLLEYERETF